MKIVHIFREWEDSYLTIKLYKTFQLLYIYLIFSKAKLYIVSLFFDIPEALNVSFKTC